MVAQFEANMLARTLTGAAEEQAISSTGLIPASISVPNVFDAANAAGIPIDTITANNLNLLATLPLSAQARARITQAAMRGQIVVVPVRMVTINGVATIGWYEIDPQTGTTIDTMESGQHQTFEAVSAWLLTFFKSGAAGYAAIAGYVAGHYADIAIDFAFFASIFIPKHVTLGLYPISLAKAVFGGAAAAIVAIAKAFDGGVALVACKLGKYTDVGLKICEGQAKLIYDSVLASVTAPFILLFLKALDPPLPSYLIGTALGPPITPSTSHIW